MLDVRLATADVRGKARRVICWWYRGIGTAKAIDDSVVLLTVLADS